jgi:hypothetical protein
MNQDGIWLSILEYAATKKTSISTIRRAIKAGHVKYREESGKYFIWTKVVNDKRESVLNSEKNEISLRLKIELLQKENRELLEELNDLKMLLAVYENQKITILPPLPELCV